MLVSMSSTTKNHVYLGDKVKNLQNFTDVNNYFDENQFYVGISLLMQKNLNLKD